MGMAAHTPRKALAEFVLGRALLARTKYAIERNLKRPTAIYASRSQFTLTSAHSFVSVCSGAGLPATVGEYKTSIGNSGLGGIGRRRVFGLLRWFGQENGFDQSLVGLFADFQFPDLVKLGQAALDWHAVFNKQRLYLVNCLLLRAYQQLGSA